MQDLLTQLRATSPSEAIGAALGLAYLLLAVRRNLLCWLCAFVSSAMYFVVFARRGVYMQSLLQVFYLAMAVIGFVDWKNGRTEQGGVLIRTWSVKQHAFAATAVGAATVLNGWFLATHTDAVAPYLDSFVTWGSVITTWMVARRVIENWLYWIIVDGFGVYLVLSQGMLPTTVLFVVYLGIVVRGYFVWRRERRDQAKLETAHVPT